MHNIYSNAIVRIHINSKCFTDEEHYSIAKKISQKFNTLKEN